VLYTGITSTAVCGARRRAVRSYAASGLEHRPATPTRSIIRSFLPRFSGLDRSSAYVRLPVLRAVSLPLSLDASAADGCVILSPITDHEITDHRLPITANGNTMSYLGLDIAHGLKGSRLTIWKAACCLGLSRVSAAVAPAGWAEVDSGAGLRGLLQCDPARRRPPTAAIRSADWASPARARPSRRRRPRRVAGQRHGFVRCPCVDMVASFSASSVRSGCTNGRAIRRIDVHGLQAPVAEAAAA